MRNVLVALAACAIFLGGCTNKGPSAPAKPSTTNPKTTSSNNNNSQVYPITINSTIASALGIDATKVCAQEIEDPNTPYVNFFAGACPTSNQVQAGSNAAFSLGLDTDDYETYYLWGDDGNYVGEMTWASPSFTLTQLCTGPYSMDAEAPASGSDICNVPTNSTKQWTGIFGVNNTDLSF